MAHRRPLFATSLGVTLAVGMLVASACGSSTPPDGSPPAAGGYADTPRATRGSGGNQGDEGGDQPVANPAPDFAVETFDGERFALAEQRGTPVVLNFWESW